LPTAKKNSDYMRYELDFMWSSSKVLGFDGSMMSSKGLILINTACIYFIREHFN